MEKAMLPIPSLTKSAPWHRARSESNRRKYAIPPAYGSFWKNTY